MSAGVDAASTLGWYSVLFGKCWLYLRVEPLFWHQSEAGRACPISWNMSQDGPQFNTVDIEVLAGDPQNPHVIEQIILGYDLSHGNTFIWNIPEDFKPRTDAFIRIKGVGVDYYSYSHHFPITSILRVHQGA